MDLARRDWSPALCGICGIAVGRLPPIRAAGAILGSTTQEVSAALGLPAATPVVNGCGDAGASLVGAGDEGGAHIYLGTSGWIARSRPFDASVLPRPFYTLAHPEDGLAIEVAPILTAGDAAAWFGRIAGAGIALLDAQASARDAAPPDLMFLPYLKGERSPFVDLALRGAFIGLDAAHDRADLHLAVLEGVALALAGVLEAMGGAAGPLRLTGGGARSRVWPQLIADACGETVECLDLPAATTAFGGFRIAAAALGWPPARAVVGARFAPRPERAERVRRRLALFRAATASLRALAVA
jgi:xylulokinase